MIVSLVMPVVFLSISLSAWRDSEVPLNWLAVEPTGGFRMEVMNEPGVDVVGNWLPCGLRATEKPAFWKATVGLNPYSSEPVSDRLRIATTRWMFRGACRL